MTSRMALTLHEIISRLRNPWGLNDELVRAARIAGADLLELQDREIYRLRGEVIDLRRNQTVHSYTPQG